MQHPALFPHPLIPRATMTIGELAFFREAMRRLKPYIGKTALTITDAPGDQYRLTARWEDPTLAKHEAFGVGATPGDALAALIAAVSPR